MNILGKKIKETKDKGLTPLEASKASRLANPKSPQVQVAGADSKFVVSVTCMDGFNDTEHHGRICEIARTGVGSISTIYVLQDGYCEGELVLSNDEVLEVIKHVKNHTSCYGPKISIQAVS